MDRHLSQLSQTSDRQSDSFIALMRHLKESCRETLKSRETSKSRSLSIDSECPRGCFPTQMSLEQEKVLSERALGKQRLVVPRPSPSEQVLEEGVRHLTDEQIDKGLLRLVGPADLETLIVLRRNETVRRAMNSETKFQGQRQDLGEDPSTYRARMDRYARLTLLIDLNSGTPASTLFDRMNP